MVVWVVWAGALRQCFSRLIHSLLLLCFVIDRHTFLCFIAISGLHAPINSTLE